MEKAVRLTFLYLFRPSHQPAVCPQDQGPYDFATIDHRAAAIALEMRRQRLSLTAIPWPERRLCLPHRTSRSNFASKSWFAGATTAKPTRRPTALEGRHGLPSGMAERFAPAEN